MFTALRRTFALFAVPAILIGAIAVPASASATPVSGTSLSAPTTVAPQGIIMRDGGICNPRWGC